MGFQMFSCCFLLFFLLSSINLSIVLCQCVQNQKDLLLELRNNITYELSLSNKLAYWNESIDCCEWNGVRCDVTGLVTFLDLSSESISGSIDDVFKFEFLQNLNLAQNFFGPDFPLGFDKLSNLSYLNLSSSGFSGQIPLEISKLTRLVVLDLSAGYSLLNLENPDLKTFIQNLSSLRELYLDGVNISATGYDWSNSVSSSMPNLQVLSIANTYLTGPFDPSLAKLKSLSVLRIDRNTFSSHFPEFFADFPNLRVLTMSSCDLSGIVPRDLLSIKSLEMIDLSNNRDLEGSLPEFHVNASLENLALSYTNFSGNLPVSIGNLRMLSNLDLRSCRFSGLIPNSFRNLTQLVYFDLSINQFIGRVPSFNLLKHLTVINLRSNHLTGEIVDSLWEGLENLNFLDLSENLLEGEIAESMFSLPLLKVLDLSKNKLNGSVKDIVDNHSFSLEALDLSVNNLEGPIPRFLSQLYNLSSFSLAWNNFNGSVELTEFRKLTNLASLDLSHNNLSVHIRENVSMSLLFPRLSNLALSSCKLQKLPTLMNQLSLMMLDLSENNLEGKIPNWIWEVGNGFLRSLNLSHNEFTTLQEPYNLRSLNDLDLNSNRLSGQIPTPPPSAVFIDFSSILPANIGNFLNPAVFFSIANNKITGPIPASLCNASQVQVLDMSNNSFNGRIPSCLVSGNLRVMNLRRNDLTGEIPNTFLPTCGLETLDLSWNHLQGKIPPSLGNCKEMEVLNLGNNNLTDSFPCFKNLSKLHVIALRSNAFYGSIICLENLSLHNLQIIDLASNKFNGVLPGNLFLNLKAMMVDENATRSLLDHLYFALLTVNQVYYQDSVTVNLKGLEVELKKILTVITSIDLSNNHFQGVVPETIGELESLYLLNISHNVFSGEIPYSIGNLQKLESLDLSVNNFGGQIPRELSRLTFLSFLNLSDNELVGRIPPGNQMQTFPESSFRRNEGLCGFPLNKTCNDVNAPTASEGESEENKKTLDDDIYVSVALGFFVGLVVIFMPLIVSKQWRTFYNKGLNKFAVLVLRQKGGNENW